MTDEDQIDRAAAVICDAYERYAPVPAVLRSEAPNIARALADLGLLADPAQTTELETLRTRIAAMSAINEDWQAYKHRKVEERRKAEPERDALSLLLRGMARKLVAYRKWMSGDDVPVVHRLRREAEERQGRIAELEASVGHHATMRGDAVAQREMLKTRIDAALAVCDEYPAGWNAPTLAHDRLRAALVGDQPPAEEPVRDVAMAHHVYEHGGGVCYGPGGTCTAERAHISGCPRLAGGHS